MPGQFLTISNLEHIMGSQQAPLHPLECSNKRSDRSRDVRTQVSLSSEDMLEMLHGQP